MSDKPKPLHKNPSFRAMRLFARAVKEEPPEQVRAALCWMLDYHRDAAQRRALLAWQEQAGER